MKSKLDGRTIHCPQNPLELAASDTLTFQGDFYGASESEIYNRQWREILDWNLNNIWPVYTFNGSGEPIKIKADNVRYTKGFDISQEMIDGTKR